MVTASKAQTLAVRAHDIVVCMERERPAEFDALSILGTAVRLALHLRGAPIVDYDLVRQVAIHVLMLAPAEVRPALDILAEAEFVQLVTEGRTTKAVVPSVPYFDDLYGTLGEVARDRGLNEMEQLTIALADKLADAPVNRDHAYGLGADKKLVDKALQIGGEGGFFLHRRARGRSILLSPSYFPENPDAFADLVAKQGSNIVGRVVSLLRKAQGHPLSVIEKTQELAGCKLSKPEIAVVRALASEGFTPPPAIETTHAGTTFFMFGPRPGTARLPPFKRGIYERAMALVAAVRQGEHLPGRYKIKYPVALLRALKNKGYIRANTEAWEQYRQVATMGIARLQPMGDGSWHRLVLIEREGPFDENKEALDMAISLLEDGGVQASADDQAVIAFAQGHSYVESLLGQKRLLVEQPVQPVDEEGRSAIDALLYSRIT